MPGLFFEFSVLLANPKLIHQLIFNAEGDFVFGHYLILFIGVFLAFVIGNSLMLLASLFQYLTHLVYRISFFLWGRIQEYMFLPILARLTHNPIGPTPSRPERPVWTPPRWLVLLYVQTTENVQSLPSQEEKEAYQWWVTLAKQLLLKRYDLAEEKLPAVSFEPLRGVLTVPTAEELRGSLLVNASQATGWAALFASRFASELCNKWYMLLAFFLIGYGLLQDWNIARRLHDPALGDMLRLRAVLHEFPNIQHMDNPEQSGSAGSRPEEHNK